MNQIQKAASFASRHHAGQRYGRHPYVYHLNQVFETVARFPHPEPLERLQVAAWLHDILEDTSCTRKALQAEFGVEVADLVWAVSDEPGSDRYEQKINTYPKTRDNSLAVYLKVCDRIANLEECIRSGNTGLWQRYADEHPAFVAGLRRKGEYSVAWNFLNALLKG